MSFRPPYQPQEPDTDNDAEWFEVSETTESVESAESIEPGDEKVAERSLRRERTVLYHGTNNDPVFGYLIALALAIGLTPLIPGNTDLRYVLVWIVLAGFGVLAWLLGTTTRIEQEKPENLAWGAVFGLIIGLPLLIVGGGTLTTTARLLFHVEIEGISANVESAGAVLGMLIFAQPLAETLFFRGVLQESRPFWLVGLLASLWSLLLYIPLLNLAEFPVVGVMIGTILVMMNMMYSYVRQRNGLAAAWLCQIVTNFVVLFLPFVGM